MEVRTRTMPVGEWMERFWRPEPLRYACVGCPKMWKNWSCPPGVPELDAYIGDRTVINLIALRVNYTDEERALRDAEEVKTVRQARYDRATDTLMTAMRGLRALSPGSLLIGAGECRYCMQCTRPQGEPCAYPEEQAYSFSAFKVDLCAMAEELFQWPLLWAKEGLPEYEVILCALVSDTLAN